MHELIIIGAGPVGLFAAFYAGMRQLKGLVIESSSTYGGQPNHLYPQKMIYDIPGINAIQASLLIENLYNQYLPFANQIPIKYNSQIKNIEQIDDYYEIKVNDEVLYTKTLLIATGNGNFNPRKLDITNANLCQNIIYKLDNLNLYKNKNIVVLGGGDSALDWANMLVDGASSLVLIHRREEFRAHEESVTKLRKSKAQILTSYQVKQINLAGDLGISLEIVDINNHIHTIPFDYCFVSYGMMPSNNIFSQILEIDAGGIKVQTNMESSLKGIFVCGNATSYLGKCRTLAAGFGEVATAITAIHQYLYPAKNPTFFSSTNYKK